jgi:hypothetical protein
MERSARQGLPTNMGWLGPSGVWPGESMDVAETYLLRGDREKAIGLLIAALNHSYTTNVWKEETLVDKTLPNWCGKPHPPTAVNQTGTGDQPEGWAHPNLLALVRNLLLREQGRTLHLLSGIPADWLMEGQKLSVCEAPTMLGKVSYVLNYPNAKTMTFELTTLSSVPEAVIHFPISKGRTIAAARVNGQPSRNISGSTVTLTDVRGTSQVEIEFK